MGNSFKEKATVKVRESIASIEKLADIRYRNDVDLSIMSDLFKEIEESLKNNKERLLRREGRYTEKEESGEGIEFEDQESEEQLTNIPSEKRRVYADKSDRSIQELHSRFIEGDLILQPEFQRYYVWDDKKASLLVESVLLEVPLPIFYLAEEAKGKFAVIDGQQRLVSLFRFLSPMKVGNQDIDALKLRGFEVLTEYNNCYFKDLPKEIQKKYTNSTLRVIEIRTESHPDVKFEIFERLNTGAVKLNDQELRNCVYRGKYNILLKELSEDRDFLFLLGLKSLHPRMVDRELILRFLTFYHNTYLKYSPPMKQFLNKEMQKFKDLDLEEEKKIKAIFKKCVELSKTVFGENAFRRFIAGTSDRNPSGQWEKRKVNRALFDLIMVGFSFYEKNQIIPKADVIREELLTLMTQDQDFINCILFTTDKKEKVNFRFKGWLQSLEEIAGIPQTEQRNFSFEFKEQLWRNNPTCRICGQRIHVLDDAEVDHIKHYWRGGETIPSNARLVHRFCNRSRGSREFLTESLNNDIDKIGSSKNTEVIVNQKNHYLLRKNTNSEIDQRSVKVWIFQTNPKYFKMIEKLKYGSDKDTWRIMRFKKEIKKGDTVLIWIAGVDAGIYAIGEIISDPEEMPVDKETLLYGTDAYKQSYPISQKLCTRAWVEYKKKFISTPLLREHLKNNSILKNLSIIKQSQGTNFRVTKEELVELKRLITF